jgi:hypothetical protein
MIQRWIWVLWPSFVMAALGEVLFFAFFDPEDLALLGEPLGLSRMAVYSIGFFALWSLGALSSAMTCFLQRTSAEINRCPLRPRERPIGCPKRVDG